jgi:hypothetical protein
LLHRQQLVAALAESTVYDRLSITDALSASQWLAMPRTSHASHVKTLTADVSPRAKLRRTMTHHAIFGILYKANADSERGRLLTQRIMEDVKILHFDGIHTLKLTFHSKRIASRYQGLITCRLQGTCLKVEDSDEEIGTAGLG